MSAAVDPDRLAELEEERRFLLRSLADLEREHAAGDVDEVDYRELRDGYTVRAAATLREIEAGQASLPPKPPTDWRRRVGVLALAAALIGVVWWVLATTTAQRLPDGSMTGADPRDERQLLLAQARALQFSQPGVAADVYGHVLELDPDDVEALAYRGWTTALDSVAEAEAGANAEATQAQLRAAIDDLARAAELDPNYPDPRCFLGIVQYRFLGQADAAQEDIDACLAFNPPADIRQLVESMLATPETTTSPTTAAGESSAPPVSNGCDQPLPAEFDHFGTVHTLVPASNVDDIEVALAVPSEPVCPSGEVVVTVTVRNLTDAETVFASNRGLMLGQDSMAKWSAGTVREVTVAAGATVTLDVTASIPERLAPGAYYLAIEGYGGRTTIEVSAPG